MTLRNPNKTRPGFTLVEMLTVIVIIGILAALTVGAGIAVRGSVKRSIVKADMGQLEIGLQKYKTEVGELPPDFAFCELPDGDVVGDAARARVARHLRKRFPRMRLIGNTNAQFKDFVIAATDLTAATYSNVEAAKRLNPSTALTFWLGGMPDTDGKPKGFHEDPTNPFKVGEPRTTPYYDFDTERLANGQLMQPGIRPPSPFIYFRAVKDKTTGRFEYGITGGSAFVPYSYGTGDNICVPYLEDCIPVPPTAAPDASVALHERIWRAPDSYQIIAAGLDGKFSSSTPAAPTLFRYSKIGENFTDADYDNLGSFADGELEDEL